MAITKTLSNRFLAEMGLAGINFGSDTFRAALMAVEFVFDPDSHGTYADISASEISGAGGYAAQALSVSSAWAQDNTNDKAALAWQDETFSASGGAYDDFSAVVIYDDSHADDVVVGCIDLGQTLTVPDGDSWVLENIGFEIMGFA